MANEYAWSDGNGNVEHLRLAARCERDAVVVVNKGKVEFVLEIRGLKSEAKTPILIIELSGQLGTELALELSAKLKKHKKVTVWATLTDSKLSPAFLEIDDGVLYRNNPPEVSP